MLTFESEEARAGGRGNAQDRSAGSQLAITIDSIEIGEVVERA